MTRFLGHIGLIWLIFVGSAMSAPPWVWMAPASQPGGITFVQQGSAGAVDPLSVTLNGIANGDTLVAEYCSLQADGSGYATAFPGFTLVTNYVSGDASGTTISVWVSYNVPAGSYTLSPTLSSAGNGNDTLTIQEYKGVHSVTSISAVDGNGTLSFSIPNSANSAFIGTIFGRALSTPPSPVTINGDSWVQRATTNQSSLVWVYQGDWLTPFAAGSLSTSYNFSSTGFGTSAVTIGLQ